jgi:predicted PhzF superfamily epimerase YddE/YHI9
MLTFTTLDVFTDTPYAGNPLAIVSIPSSLRPELSKSQKQSIAQEFNLSESVFLHEAANPSIPEWEVEIFTTDEELPFAGHPTIGSAFYALSRYMNVNTRNGAGTGMGTWKGQIEGTLITKAGRIPISYTSTRISSGSSGGGGRVQASIPHNICIHRKTLASSLPASTAGLSPHFQIRKAELSAPLVSIVKGMTFLLVQLPSLQLLSEVKIGVESMNFAGVLDSEDSWNESFVAKYYFVVLPSDIGDKKIQVRSRMVEAMLEDPATGSAACALSSYLSLKAGRSGKFEVTQGVEMGRRSVIGVDVILEVDGENRRVDSVTLSGSAVVVMEGGLRI